jgi:hypothetical protein
MVYVFSKRCNQANDVHMPCKSLAFHLQIKEHFVSMFNQENIDFNHNAQVTVNARELRVRYM